MPRKGRKTKIQTAVASFENFTKHIDQTFLNLIKTKNIDAICYIIKKINQNHARKPKDVERLMMLKFLQKNKTNLEKFTTKRDYGKTKDVIPYIKVSLSQSFIFFKHMSFEGNFTKLINLY